MQALEFVGIADLAERSLGSLSGGELQRVYVARVLVRRPALVLLDEPATGMDISAEQDLHHLLEAYQEETKATIVMISHDWDTAQHHASHVLLINQRMRWFGATEDGPSEAVMRSTFGHVGHAHPMQHAGHEQCEGHRHD
jgi:zinc transport system ATP-binding protein